jgi:hypothetical protein
VPGMLFQEQPDDRISNLYNIQFVNKTYEDVLLEVKLKDHPSGFVKRVGEEEVVIPGSQSIEGVFFIELPKSDLTERKTEVIIQLYWNGELFDELETNFLGPLKYN